MPERAPLQPLRREHLSTLARDGPISQHATGTVPDPAHGTCADDVARALQVDLLHGAILGWQAVAASAWRSLRYLDEAIGPSGRARNFRDAEGRWLEEVGSEDCHGRVVLALGEAVAAAGADAAFREGALTILQRALPGAATLTALRGASSALLGCEAALRADVGGVIASIHHLLAETVAADFQPVAWSTTWPWPEEMLTYETPLPARALIVAGRRMGDRRMTEMGLAVLDWLVRGSTAAAGHLSPIGNGWWPRGGIRARFDQQPIEAESLLRASEAALKETGDPRYEAEMERAYAWFLGANDLGVALADPARGGCRDGLSRHGANANQGAESTLAWLQSLERIRLLRRRSPALAA